MGDAAISDNNRHALPCGLTKRGMKDWAAFVIYLMSIDNSIIVSLGQLGVNILDSATGETR